MVWVQHFIVGRAVSYENPKLFDALNERYNDERPDWDYMFERVGAVFGYNNRRPPLPELDGFIEDFVDQNDIRITVSQQRRLFIDMCMTRCADAWWAKDVQAALSTVERGAKSHLFEPEKGAHGSADSLFFARYLACLHVNYLHGKGAKKIDARLQVGEVIGVSDNTLKYWEGLVKKDELTDFNLHCGYIFGFFEEELSTHPQDRSEELQSYLDNVIEPHSFKFIETQGRAMLLGRTLQQYPVENVRELLNEAKKQRG